MATLKTYRVSEVTLALPAAYALQDSKEETMNVLDLPGMETRGVWCRWEDEAGRSLFIRYWSNGVPYPGQPLVIEREWKVPHETLAIGVCRCKESGEEASLHAWFEWNGGHYKLVGQGMHEGEFEEMLSAITVQSSPSNE